MRKLVVWVLDVRTRRNAADLSDVPAGRAVIQFMMVGCLLVMTAREMFHPLKRKSVGRSSIVCVATRYGLDGAGNRIPVRVIFCAPSRTAVGPTHPPIKRVPTFFSGSKAAGTWR